MEEIITIKKDEYFQLKLDSEKLGRLENGGVDNWEWYGESMNPHDEPDMERYEDKIREKIAQR